MAREKLPTATATKRGTAFVAVAAALIISPILILRMRKMTMRAKDEIALLNKKLASGEILPDEPLFVLRARDITASQVVDFWCCLALDRGVPREKRDEAAALAAMMRDWPTKQIPGRPETRVTHGGSLP